DLAGDQIEQRRLAGAVRADDQATLAGRDRKIDVGGDAQAAELLAEIADAERSHGTRSSLGCGADAPVFACGLFRIQRKSRTEPGPSPSGMKLMMTTKMTPSTRFQRSI